jgi:hypothetical protein
MPPFGAAFPVISQQFETSFLCQIWNFSKFLPGHLQYKRFHFTIISYLFLQNPNTKMEEDHEKDNQHAVGAGYGAEPDSGPRCVRPQRKG